MRAYGHKTVKLNDDEENKLGCALRLSKKLLQKHNVIIIIIIITILVAVL